ncbi:hypothetical protein B0H13DRAFT_1881710 [Mycena leptocephala]|nr:hypothetical protein B0H13DRAFT_1881710 [Mycena leptocephala]
MPPDDFARRWVLEHTPAPPHFPACTLKPKGHHSKSLYLAVNHPINEERFAEWSFYCNKTCRKPPVPLDEAERLRLWPLFQAAIAQYKAEVAATRKREKAEVTAAKRAEKAEVAAVKKAEKVEVAAAKRKEKAEMLLQSLANARQRSLQSQTKGKATGEPVADDHVLAGKHNLGGYLAAANPSADIQSNGKGKAKETANLSANVRSNGKGKAKETANPSAVLDVELNGTEDDEYNSDMYKITADERRRVQIIVFMDANTPIQHTVNLRAVSHFNFKFFQIARSINAVSDSDSGLPYSQYLWYCPLKNEWLLLNSAINLNPRRAFFILRLAALPESQCIGLLDWIEKGLDSVLALAPELDSDDSDSDDDNERPQLDSRLGEDEQNEWVVVSDSESELPTSSMPILTLSMPSLPSSTPSSSLKRKASWTSPLIEAKMHLLAQEDEEDKQLAAQIRGSAQKDGPKK